MDLPKCAIIRPTSPGTEAIVKVEAIPLNLGDFWDLLNIATNTLAPCPEEWHQPAVDDGFKYHLAMEIQRNDLIITGEYIEDKLVKSKTATTMYVVNYIT
jgi:hypothetical protein